jgi:hypothetical protein
MDSLELAALSTAQASPQLTNRYYSKAVWGGKLLMHPISTLRHPLAASNFAFSGRNRVMAKSAYLKLHSSVPFRVYVSLMSNKSVRCTVPVSLSQATSYPSFVCIPVTVAGNLLCRVPND